MFLGRPLKLIRTDIVDIFSGCRPAVVVPVTVVKVLVWCRVGAVPLRALCGRANVVRALVSIVLLILLRSLATFYTLPVWVDNSRLCPVCRRLWAKLRRLGPRVLVMARSIW